MKRLVRTQAWARLGTGGLMALVALAAFGCTTGKKTGTISGVVKMPDGKPLPEGEVVAMGEGGKSVARGGITDGKYSITGLPVGHATISIVVPPPPTPVKKPGAPPPKQPKPLINPRYGNSKTSGLELMVKQGDNPYDIDLKP